MTLRRPWTEALATAVLSIAAVVLSGCGGSTPTSTSPASTEAASSPPAQSASATSADPSSHPCDFVTQAEAQAIIKEAIQPPVIGVSGGCKYAAAGSSTKETILGFPRALDKTAYDLTKKTLTAPEDVAGLGDAATCETHNGSFGTTANLIVYVSKQKLLISLAGDSCGELVEFARRALARF